MAARNIHGSGLFSHAYGGDDAVRWRPRDQLTGRSRATDTTGSERSRVPPQGSPGFVAGFKAFGALASLVKGTYLSVTRVDRHRDQRWSVVVKQVGRAFLWSRQSHSLLRP
jgi:hypothetical protein